jgi:GT2 family glycosyltransferase
MCLQTVPHSVVVVDNGSSDGTPEKVRAGFAGARLLELGENRGFPYACNRGAAFGDGEIVVLLNNDTEPQPDFLERLVAPFAAEDVGSAAALLVRPDGVTIDSMGLTADRTLAPFPRLRGASVANAASPSPVLSGPAGGGGAYRRTAWTAVEGLDAGVLFYGEDLDLALRLRSAGWRTVGVPGAVAIHVGSATAGHRSSWQRFQGGFARGYFARRYRLLHGRVAARTLLTESVVMVGDAVISRDLTAARGRLAGWRAAKNVQHRTMPPPAAYDQTIGFGDSLRLRRTVYAS